MKRKILITIFILFLFIILITGTALLVRYYKYKDFIGTYKLVEGEYLDNLKLNLYDWSLGNKEDLECNLWNCEGYKSGSNYVVKGNKIYFYFDSYGLAIYNYEIKEDEGNKDLILRSDNFEVIYRKK